MGYFSELDAEMREEERDNSYHSFEEQLIWRCEELMERYLMLCKNDAPTYAEDRFGMEDHLYAPTESFKTLSDTYRAMEAVMLRLKECGIYLDSIWHARSTDGATSPASIYGFTSEGETSAKQTDTAPYQLTVHGNISPPAPPLTVAA